jgi:membrane-bound inhibitor of C-type lysozyme
MTFAKPLAVAGLAAAVLAACASPAAAQTGTFQSYTCADGTRFTAAYYQHDPKQAHLQIDGKAVALRKRFTLTGTRYSGSGIILVLAKIGVTIKHGRRRTTACSVD